MSTKKDIYVFFVLLFLFTILFVTVLGQREINRELLDRIAITERINEEQQAFIRNHRIDHLDIQEQFNLHAEQLGLIWNRIP
jgi:hypothetical protein